MDAFVFFLLGLGVALAVILARGKMAAFAGQTPEDYAEGFPQFSLPEHLTGDMICEGVIFGPLGKVTSSFVADFHIHWTGNTAVMDEHFRYNDGSTQDRRWIITCGEDGRFTTEADDVPGGGVGVEAGMAVQMSYAIRLPEEGGGHLLNTVDWMYLTPDGVIVNRSQFRKFGFKVAELIATIRPRGR